MGRLIELASARRSPPSTLAALAFLVTALDAERGVTPAIIVGTAWFVVGLPVLRTGAEWLADPGRSAMRAWVTSAIALANVPLLVGVALATPPLATVLMLATATIAVAAVVPPLRWAERPVADVVTSAALLGLPALAGSIAGGRPPAELPAPALLGLLAWAGACRTIEAIAGLEHDRARGARSVATAVGAAPAAAGALASFAFATFVGLGMGGPASVAAVGLATYLLLPLAVACRPDADQASRAARSLPGLHGLAGSLLAVLLLVHWGIVEMPLEQLAIGLAIIAPTICLAQLVTTDWLLRVSRRRAMERATTVGARLPRLSVVVLVDRDAASAEALLDLLAAQDHPDLEVVIVGPPGADSGALERSLAGARPWSTDRDRVIGMSGRDPADLGAAIWAGLRVTTGAHLLVLRGDCRPAVNATRELHAIALASKAGLVSGVPGYAMPSLAERALVPGYPMTILGLRPLWVTLATRGRYRWLAYANPALLLIERAATVDDSKGPDATDEQVAGRPGTVTTDAADPGDGPAPPPPAGLLRTRTAIDIARWVVDRGGRVRLVDALDLAASRPHPDGDGGLQAWRRSSLLVADRSFGRLLAWMLATGAAWLLPTVAPMVGLALDRPDLVLGGLVALAAVATFRIVLALLERQPLGVVVFHPATTIGLLAAQTAGLADAVLGRAIAPPTDGPGGEAE